MATATIQNRFSYSARDQRGQSVTGVVNALTQHEATKLLRAEGKYILDIKPCRVTQEGAAASVACCSIALRSMDFLPVARECRPISATASSACRMPTLKSAWKARLTHPKR